VDVNELAGRIRDHRFDGWTDTAIAGQIDKFREGVGTAGIGTAVDALKAVAKALGETDYTLRTELKRLGVEWQSKAGGAAGQVFTEQAGFSQDATMKVAHASEMVFEQGESFNRTKNKLPDAETVRKGAGGFTLTDTVLSLIGFETDHAADVLAANDAREQAQQALNDYAQQSGSNLLTTETLSDPEQLKVTTTDTGPGVLDVAGSAVQVTPDGSVKPASDHVRSHHVDPPAAQPVSNPVPIADPPTPKYGVVAQPRHTGVAPAAGGGSTVPASSTTPAGVRPPSSTPGWVGTPPPGRGPGSSSAPDPVTGRFPTDIPPDAFTGGNPASPATAPIKALGGQSGTTDGPVTGGGGSPAGSSREAALPKGRVVASMPQPPLPPSGYTGERGFTPRPGVSAGELGAGAAALGAGTVGGALSGEKERARRAPGAPKGPVKPLPVGELPEEEAAALRKSEQISPKQPRGDAKFLSEAAPHGEDAEHVRRFGVDDKDLFTDQRMVSPDVIGDGEEVR